MKKLLAANLTAAVVLSMSATTFAENADTSHRVGKFSWNAQLEATFAHEHNKRPYSRKKENKYNSYSFYFAPEYTFNKNWTAVGELEIFGNFKKMDASLNSLWFESDYGKFALGLGLVPLYTNEDGLIFSTAILGGGVVYGDDLYVLVGGGKLDKEDAGGGLNGKFVIEDDKSTVAAVNVQYEREDPGAYGGAGFYYLKDDDFKTFAYSKSGDTDKANIWSANAGYRFDDKLKIFGAYAQNTKADYEKNSWQVQVEYGNYDDYPERGDWSVWAGYRRYGTNVSFQPMDDDTMRGTRGWNVGASYAPIKNLGVTARYFRGKYITGTGDSKAEKVFGEIEFFF